VKTHRRIKKLQGGAVNKEGTGWSGDTRDNHRDPGPMKAEVLHSFSQEILVDAIISSLHIKFDGHQTTLCRSTPKIIHKFLGYEHIIKNAATRNKGSLL